MPFIASCPGTVPEGKQSDSLQSLVDLAPTFLELMGGEAKPHILEGRSLVPFLNGKTPDDWREYAISEYDYSTRQSRLDLQIRAGPDQSVKDVLGRLSVRAECGEMRIHRFRSSAHAHGQRLRRGRHGSAQAKRKGQWG